MSNEHEIEVLRFQLLAASCYIDALGGDSRSYRAALAQPATSATAAKPLTYQELEDIAVEAGIYWVSENTAYMHPEPMRKFADAIAAAERERCALVCEKLSTKASRARQLSGPGSLEGDTGFECADAIRGIGREG